MGQKFAAFDAAGKIIAYYDDQDSPVPNGVSSVIEISDDQWLSCISAPGYTVRAGALVAPPETTEAQLLAEAQAAQIAKLSTACNAQILAGFSSSALGSPHTYPANLTDQANLSSSVVTSLLPGLVAGWTTPFWCADVDGTWALVPHTAAQIQKVGADSKVAILTAIQKNAHLVAQVRAATTVVAAKAVVW